MNKSEFRINFNKYHTERVKELAADTMAGNIHLAELINKQATLETELLKLEKMRIDDDPILCSRILKDVALYIDTNSDAYRNNMEGLL